MAKKKRAKKSQKSKNTANAKKKASPKKPARGVKAPSSTTAKRLYSLSGNRCGFKRCATPMLDNDGTVLGEICHIKGDKPGAKRYDASQTDAERQGFDNLILMCSVHHKKIDSDDTKYTVEFLTDLKAKHEVKQKPVEANDRIANQLITKLVSHSVVHGSVIASQGQTGGQVAHSIRNIYNVPPPADEEVKLDGRLRPQGNQELLKQFDSAGLELLVINRGKRAAKISDARLCIDGVGFLQTLREGFENRISKHDPPPGHEKETMWVAFSAMAEKNHAEGFVLERDDVCRFFLPLGGYVPAVMEAKADDVYCRVTLFDESKITLLRGDQVQGNISAAVEMYKDWPRGPNLRMNIGVEVLSLSPPDTNYSLMGMANTKAIRFGKPIGAVGEQPEYRVDIEFGVAGIGGEWTISVEVSGLPEEINKHLQAVLILTDKNGKHHGFLCQRVRTSIGKPRAAFILPIQCARDIVPVTQKIGPDRYWMSLGNPQEECARIEGKDLKIVLDALDKQLQAGAKPVAPSPPP